MTNHTDNDRAFLLALGERLAEIRRLRGYSQELVAERASLDPQTIQRTERGKTAISLVRLRVVAGVLGVPMAALFEGIGEPIPEPPRDPGEAKLVSTWNKIAAEHRDLALKVLRAFTSR